MNLQELDRPKYAIMLVGLLAFVLYANTLWNGFVFDDEAVLTQHQSVLEGVGGIGEIFANGSWWGYNPESDLHIYRPLQLTALAIQYEIFGLNPFVYHLVQVLSYACLCVALLMLLRKILYELPHGASLALLTTVLYTAHPIHTEVVANIKGNGDLLAFLFGLLSLHQLWDYCEKKVLWRLLLSGLFFLTALLCKETVVTLIGVAGLMLFIFTKHDLKKIAVSLIPMAVAVVTYLVLRALIFGEGANELESQGLHNVVFLADGISQEIGMRMYALGKNLQLLLFPYPLLMMYVYDSVPMVEAYEIASLFPAIIYTTITLLFFYNLRRRNITAFVCGSYLMSIFLFSNILFTIPNILSERWLFIPSFSICLALAYLLLIFYQHYAKATQIVLGLLLFGYCGYTIQRNFDWKSNYSLSKRDVVTSPNSVLINTTRGGVLFKKATAGEELNEETLRESIAYYEQSIRLNPSDAGNHNLIGIAYEKLGEHGKAAEAFKSAASFIWNNQVKAQYSYAKNLNLAGRYSEALNVWQDLEKNYPQEIAVKRSMIEAFKALGQIRNALAKLVDLSILEPNNLPLHQEIAVLSRQIAIDLGYDQDLLRQSLEYYKKSLAAGANPPITYNNIGIVYADLGMHREAAEAFAEASKEESPIQGKASFSMAKHLGLSNQPNEAYQAWLKVDRTYPNTIEVQYELGRLLQTHGHKEEAGLYFNRAIELINAHPNADNYTEILEQSRQFFDSQ